MRTTDQVRARRWLWATLPVAALLLAAAGLLGFQVGAVARGVALAGAGDQAAAERAFAAADRVATVDRWVPVFDHGTTQYRLKLWDSAAADFERAAGLAPSSAQCRIRLNWAWSLEAGADELMADDVPGAVVRLQQAQLVLSTAPCPGELSPSDERDSPDGSLEQQWNDTRQRIETKTGDAPPRDADDSGEEPEDKDNQLNDREQQALEQRQQVIDEGTRAESEEGQKTW